MVGSSWKRPDRKVEPPMLSPAETVMPLLPLRALMFAARWATPPTGVWVGSTSGASAGSLASRCPWKSLKEKMLT